MRRLRRMQWALLFLTAAITARGDALDNANLEAAVAASDWARAQAIVAAALAETPDDPQLQFQKARLFSWSGDYAVALDEYESLLERFPDNVDFLLGRAQVYVWNQAYEAARVDLDRARILAPRYEEVWRLQFLVSQQLDSDAQVQALRLIASAEFPDAIWWRAAEPKNVRRVTMGSGRDLLSSGLPGWNEHFVRFDWSSGKRWHHFTNLSRFTRYERGDTSLTLGGDRGIRSNWNAGYQVSLAPDGSFHPEHVFAVHAGRSFPEGWGATVQYVRRSYSTADVSTTRTGLERYVGAYRIAYDVSFSRLNGSNSSTYQMASVGWFPTARSGIALSFGQGDETESIAPSVVLTTEVKSVSLNGRNRLSEKYGLNWWVGTHRQGDFYRRRYAGLALSIEL